MGTGIGGRGQKLNPWGTATNAGLREKTLLELVPLVFT